MSHDEWRDSLRIHGSDPATLATLLTELPSDGLQHAGAAILAYAKQPGLRPIATNLIRALKDRDWEGDSELADALQAKLDGIVVALKPSPIDLDELSEALDQSSGEFLINFETGMVWPGQLLEVGEEPPDYDVDDPGAWESYWANGSGPAFDDMRRFVESLSDVRVVRKLEDALHGRGAFRRFRDTLSRFPEEFTAWHRFRDDARLGRARSWLANEGYRPVDD